MRPIVILLSACCLTLPSGSPARADFLLGHPADAAAQSSGLAIPPVPPAPNTDAAPADPVVTPPRFKLVKGFGRGVPLAFAIRQIVPARIVVRYGRGVDEDSLVDWSGNAPWNRVLAAAVRPLRLRVLTSASSVLISR